MNIVTWFLSSSADKEKWSRSIISFGQMALAAAATFGLLQAGTVADLSSQWELIVGNAYITLGVVATAYKALEGLWFMLLKFYNTFTGKQA